MATYDQYGNKRTQVDLEGFSTVTNTFRSTPDFLRDAYQSIVDGFGELDEILWVGADAKDYRDSMQDDLEFFTRRFHALERMCAICCGAYDDYVELQQRLAGKLPSEGA